MQTQNPFFDDLARMMSGAMGVASGMREEMEAQFRQLFENATSRMDLVRRDEFEAVKAMAVKAREENEALAKRLAALEQAQAGGPKPAARSAGVAKKSPDSAKRAGKTRTKSGPAKPAGGAGTAGEGPTD